MTRSCLGGLLLFGTIMVLLDGCKPSENVKPISKITAPCGGHVLSGYTDKNSYFAGEEMEVYLQGDSVFLCGLTIYTINKTYAFSSPVNLSLQQSPMDGTPWANGFNYVGTAVITLPPTLASGVYAIENSIRFVVKSAGSYNTTIVYPTNTIEAYNDLSGKSLYSFNSSNSVASPIVSFLRPTETTEPELDFCTGCFTWISSLPPVGVAVNYIADRDLEDYTTFEHGQLLIIAGHSEYWTRKARVNFDAFVDGGGHAIILSGNSMCWQIRYTPNDDGEICYRDAQTDPENDPLLKTILWADPALKFSTLSSIGADFNHGGYGMKNDNGWDGYKIANPDSPLLEGLDLSKGDIISLATDEYDGAPISGFDNDGFPILDNSILDFERFELIGFDKGIHGSQQTVPTFIVFQKTKTSGIIVNTSSTNWCSSTGISSPKSGDQIKRITLNAIIKLLNGLPVFSE